MMIAQNNQSSPTQSTTSPYSYQQSSQPHHLDFDAGEPFDSESLASSPHSTQSSLLSQYSFQHSPLSTTFAPHRPLANIRQDFKFPATTPTFESASVHGGDVQHNILNLSQVPDLMPSAEQWLLHGQQQTPRAALRLGHHRESSLSSLGSNGPASPYNPNTSNPHIAVTDSSGEGFHDLGGGDNYSYHAGKPLGLNENFYASLHNFGAGGASFGDQLNGMPSAGASQQQRPRVDRNLLPAPELSMGPSSRSHPVSVASSIAGGDSPATPSYHDAEDDVRRRKNGFNHIPKLDRTMTDIYSDELYSPNFTITSASPPTQTHMAMSTNNDLFAQRLQAANSQHLSAAAHSPLSMSSRHQSPFRNGSPLAPSLNDFSQAANQARMTSAQQLREQQQAEHNAKMVQQQLAHSAGQQHQQQGTPSTISPKDALLEFNEADDASNFPLFPVHETHGFGLGSPMGKMMPSAPQQQQPQQTSQGFSTTPLQSAFNFNMPTGIQVPQQYPFVARPRQAQQPHLQMNQPQQEPTPSISTFSRMSSAETSHSDSSSVPVQRPTRVNADGGTYTCTYHGCTQRFETPALLQKHKREGHRQANALTNARAPVPSEDSPDSLFNTQAGPHRCDRINPSTGKPCNTIFSRPYDLTRHEDTIHNARKQKVRCNLCTEEKTFSRADALTRHYRVCHPDVDFPGKHRRRGGSTI